MDAPLLIFDMDGVLVDSEDLATAVLGAHLRRHGVSVTDAEATARFRGRRLEDCFALVTAQYGVTLPPDFRDTLQAETYAVLRAQLQPVAHVAWALETLQALPCCLASSSEPEKIQLSLEVTGLDRFFPPERRFSGSQVARGKPAPDLFRFAAAQCGVPAHDCLVIEDSPPGVQAGIRAGMFVLGYAARGHSDQDALVLEGAITFSDMRSLPAMVQGVWNNLVRARSQGRL